MNYSQQIKEKIKELYLSRLKIGKKDKINLFNFLDKYEFTPNEVNNKIVSHLSAENLKKIKKEISLSPEIFNSIDNFFIKQLSLHINKNSGVYFFQDTAIPAREKVQDPQTIFNIESQLNNYKIKYGLKELIYVFNFTKSDAENTQILNKFLLKMEQEFQCIKTIFNITKDNKIGNNILGVELDFTSEEDIINGEYNSCSNTLVINNLENPPIIHEYVHFIDKTCCALLLTGKTTQELFEAGDYSIEQIVNVFDMSHFKKKKYSFSAFFKSYSFNQRFNPEIFQNNYINNTFNAYDSKKEDLYKKEFKRELHHWLGKQKISNRTAIFNECCNILDNKKHKEEVFIAGSPIHMTLRNTCILYSNTAPQFKENNFMLFAKILDKSTTESGNNNNIFYAREITYQQSQKEMLARTIEKNNSTMPELSNRLSTPTLSQQQNSEFIKIISSWKQNIDSTLSLRENKPVTARIQELSKKYRSNEEHLNCIKKQFN